MAGKIYKVAKPTPEEMELAIQKAKIVKKRHNKFTNDTDGGVHKQKNESHYKKLEQISTPLRKSK